MQEHSATRCNGSRISCICVIRAFAMSMAHQRQSNMKSELFRYVDNRRLQILSTYPRLCKHACIRGLCAASKKTVVYVVLQKGFNIQTRQMIFNGCSIGLFLAKCDFSYIGLTFMVIECTLQAFNLSDYSF